MKKLRKASVAVYLATEEGPAYDLSEMLRTAAELLAALSPLPEPYPGSDRGLAEMFPGVSIPMLRGVQEAAFRAGRASALAPPP